MITFEYYNFIIPKMVLAFKYEGGLEQFKLDTTSYSYQEDDQLASVSFNKICDIDQFLTIVKHRGLDYDKEANHSEDFAVYSFIGFWWPSEWLIANPAFCTLNQLKYERI